MTNVAVILSGCGHLDGAEIRESVLTLLYLDQQDANVSIFAPDISQMHVVNHLVGEETNETRNVLVEAARIARGDIQPLRDANASNFDALILPGGFGAAKNLSDFAVKGKDCTVLPAIEALIRAFYTQKKPIGAICIAPAVLAATLGKDTQPTVTIGEDKDTATAIESLGGAHKDCATSGYVLDSNNRLATCSAYMRNDRISEVAQGIEKVVKAVLTMADAQKAAA